MLNCYGRLLLFSEPICFGSFAPSLHSLLPLQRIAALSRNDLISKVTIFARLVLISHMSHQVSSLLQRASIFEQLKVIFGCDCWCKTISQSCPNIPFQTCTCLKRTILATALRNSSSWNQLEPPPKEEWTKEMPEAQTASDSRYIFITLLRRARTAHPA